MVSGMVLRLEEADWDGAAKHSHNTVVSPHTPRPLSLSLSILNITYTSTACATYIPNITYNTYNLLAVLHLQPQL